MNNLEKLVSQYSQKYYTDGTSEISDEEFDKLLEAVRSENPESEVLDVGHGYKVDLDSTPGDKYDHKYGVAGSLVKCHNWSELSKSISSEVVDVSLKLDGLSVVLYYVNGELHRALTRGDGHIGIDITDKVRRIDPKYSLVGSMFTGAIRGEIVMSFANFDEFSKQHPEAKNPRNSTAGLINGKELVEDLKFLDIIVYTVVGNESSYTFNTCKGVRWLLCQYFGESRVVPHMSEINLHEESFESYMDELRNSWYGTYPADGIVITRERITEDGFAVTYDANAYKFKSEVAVATVIDVEWRMTKSHYAMPRIHIEPVQLAGTTVEYCTGYNAKFIQGNRIGPYSKLAITKSGEIIPNVDEVLESSYPDLITHCPDCNTKLIWDGVHLKCPNLQCGNAVTQDTLCWLEQLVPIDGLGDTLKLKFLNMLVDHGYIENLSIEAIMESGLKLPEDTDSAQLNTFNTMWNQLHSDSSISVTQAILALNVPRFGEITSAKLSGYPDIFRNLIILSRLKLDGMGPATLDPLTMSELSKLLGVANAGAIKSNLWKFSRLRYIQDRLVYEDLTSTRKVAITGKLSVSRSEFEKELKNYGFVLSDVSKDTQYLITDNPDSSSSKNKKADKLGITKITEAEFRSQFMR